MSNKILVVDDSPADLQNIKSIVTNAGYTAITASSGQEAVTKAIEMMPDMIFMDVIMENTDGFEACREIISNRETRDIPIVFVSSKCQKADRVWAELQGGKALVGKPYTEAEIVEQINTYS